MTHPTVGKLRQATDDLLYPSESDASFEVVHWPDHKAAPTAAELAKVLGRADEAEELTIDEFFESLVEEDDSQDDEEKAIVQRFRDLKKIIEQELKNAKVFRFGSVEVTIFIVGCAKEGDWIGLKTSSVET